MRAVKRRFAGCGPLVPVVVLVLVVVAELTLFNLPFWTTLGAEPVDITEAPGWELEGVAYDRDRGGFYLTEEHGRFTFDGPDTEVVSIYVEPRFDEPKTRQPVRLVYDDAGSSGRETQAFDLVEGFEQNNYIVPVLMGEVRRVGLVFDSDKAAATIGRIVVNQPVPLFFSWVRVLVLTGAVLLAWGLIGRGWWRHRFDPRSVRQSRINTAVVLAALVVLAAVTCWTTAPTEELPTWSKALNDAPEDRFTKLVDAFEAGQTALLDPPSQELIDAERPYDTNYRYDHGIPFEWDLAYYDGKYYCYFGVVPTVLLLWPYHHFYDEHLPTRWAAFLAAAVATIALYLVWRETVRRLLRRLPYVAYLAGFAALFAASHIVYLVARPEVYETVIAAGLACCLVGVWALSKATSPGPGPRLPWYGLSALALALAVGCRPNLLLVSLIVPFFIQCRLREAPRRRAAAILATMAVPYAAVGAGLAWYNYIRFGSILEFGASYQLTVNDVGAYTDKGLLALVLTVAYGLYNYLFVLPEVEPVFPYFRHPGGQLHGFLGYMYSAAVIGAFSLPIHWLLAVWPPLRRRLRRRVPGLTALLLALVGVGLLLMATTAVTAGLNERYEADFMWLFTFPALIVSYEAYAVLARRGLEPAACAGLVALALATVAIMGPIGLLGEDAHLFESNPDIYYAIRHLMSIR
jgi:hypothetical protein